MEQWKSWRNSTSMTQHLPRASPSASQENDGRFSNSPRKPPKTTRHHLPPAVPHQSPDTGLTTKVKLLGDVAR